MCFDAKRKGDCLESLNKDGRVEVLLNTGLIYEGEHKLEFVFIYLFIYSYDYFCPGPVVY